MHKPSHSGLYENKEQHNNDLLFFTICSQDNTSESSRTNLGNDRKWRKNEPNGECITNLDGVSKFQLLFP